MADRSAELHAALYTALAGSAALTALISAGAVLSGVRDGTKPPYVDIAEATATDYSGDLVDAQEHTITVHAWTEQPVSGGTAKKLCLDVVAAVRAALHMASLVLSAGTLCNLRCEMTEMLRDPDGISWH